MSIFVLTALPWGGAIAAARDSSPPVPAGLNGPVHAAVYFDKTLVVGGEFSAAGSVTTGPVACWNGLRWTPLGAPLDGPVYALAVLNGELIAGGAFTHSAGDPVAHVARWNDRMWEPVGMGTDGPVHALAVQADVFLYAGGEFQQAGGVTAHGVARYFAGTWSNIGGGVDGDVRALVVYNGALVAGGDFVIPGSPGYDRYLARFTNGTWQILAWGIDAPVSALTVWNGTLIAGGAFTQADFVTPARGIAAFVGETWSEIGVGVTSESGTAEVQSLWVDGTALVAGGTFESAGMSPAHNVARWDGTSWSAVDDGTNGAVKTLVAYGSMVVAGGAFTRAGQSAADCVAALADGRWCALETTPVAVHDVTISREPNGIRLEWSLDPQTLAGLRGVFVERTAQTGDGGVRVTGGLLAPATRMTVIDRAPDAARRWYRIVLVEVNGQETAGATVSADAFVLPRTGIQSVTTAGTPAAVTISYVVAVRGRIQLDVCDVRGRKIALVAQGPRDPGAYQAQWSARDSHGSHLPRGVYFVRLRAQDGESVRKFHSGG